MAEYDQIATEYLASKTNGNYREDVEYHTFLHRLLLPALGIKDAKAINLQKALTDYRVLDLGCGGGYLTRKLGQELGCKDIVGVGISSNMIAIGNASEEAHPLGIIYQVSDVLHLTKPAKKFDFVVAFYLLNYAKTRDELDQMAQIISEQLHDNGNGYFLSITWNTHVAERIINSDIYRQHGYRCEAKTPLIDGAQVKNIHFNSDGSSFSYITYYFSPKIYEQAFQKAGFKHFEWVPMEAARDIEKYEDFLTCPALIGISAYK